MAIFLASACESEGLLVVEMKTDLDAPTEIDRAVLRVSSEGGGAPLEARISLDEPLREQARLAELDEIAAGARSGSISTTCDLAESCTGSSANCPADQFRRSSSSCRAAVDEMCDFEEYCTGSSATCPANQYASFGTPCDDFDDCTSDDRCRLMGHCMGTPTICSQ